MNVLAFDHRRFRRIVTCTGIVECSQSLLGYIRVETVIVIFQMDNVIINIKKFA